MNLVLSVSGPATTPYDSPNIRRLTLMAAIVRRAVLDWSLYRRSEDLRERRIFRSARNWLFSDDEEFPSFVVLCHHLDVDPAYIRERVLSLTDEEVRALRGVDFGNGS